MRFFASSSRWGMASPLLPQNTSGIENCDRHFVGERNEFGNRATGCLRRFSEPSQRRSGAVARMAGDRGAAGGDGRAGRDGGAVGGNAAGAEDDRAAGAVQGDGAGAWGVGHGEGVGGARTAYAGPGTEGAVR